MATTTTTNVSQSASEKPDVAQASRDVDEAPMKPDELVMDAAAKGQATSGYETLTVWQTVKKFKAASLACFFAAFSAGTDGYQLA